MTNIAMENPKNKWRFHLFAGKIIELSIRAMATMATMAMQQITRGSPPEFSSNALIGTMATAPEAVAVAPAFTLSRRSLKPREGLINIDYFSF